MNAFREPPHQPLGEIVVDWQEPPFPAREVMHGRFCRLEPLDVSKLELSQPASGQIAFDLPEMIASVISIVRASGIDKGLDLHSHIDGRLSSSYVGDSSLLRQCLLNLVTNAVKFTDKGGISVTVKPALASAPPISRPI